MNVAPGLSPTVQEWVRVADNAALIAKFLEYAARREIKARDAEFVALIRGAIVAELGGRGVPIPEIEDAVEDTEK